VIRPSRPILAFLAAAALLSTAAPAAAQDPPADLSGSWGMDTTATMPDDLSQCVFEGSCEMDQDGSSLTGRVFLHLVSGPAECPPLMGADLEGSVQGDEVVMGAVMDGGFGQASFTGARTNSFAGDFVVTEGPFTGTTGTWAAERLELSEIPTLDVAGLAVLALVLVATGAFFLRRRRRAAV
jgi:hypothetical protein